MASRHRERSENPAVRRALRAAAAREPLLPPGFFEWSLGRVLALVLMLGAAWLIRDWASSPGFQVRSVRVSGNVLLTPAEITDSAGVIGANIFWVNRADVAARLRALPLVQAVEVIATLPDTVDVHVVERQPAGFWNSGDQTYLVDAQGVILKAVDAETEQIHACAGQPCDPRLAALPSVAQVDAAPLSPGDRIDASVLNTSANLETLLPSVGIEPRSFTWSADAGVEVLTSDGWRARFDSAGDLDQQVVNLRSVRDALARAKTSATLIDVRFQDRPYFQ